MSARNNCFFVGRLGADATLRMTTSGTAVLSWSMAVDVGYGDRRETLWIDCALFGQRAESLQQHLRKGRQVAVVGEIGLRQYTTRDGQHRATLTLRVEDLALLGGGERREQQAQQTQPAGESPFDQPDDGSMPF